MSWSDLGPVDILVLAVVFLTIGYGIGILVNAKSFEKYMESLKRADQVSLRVKRRTKDLQAALAIIVSRMVETELKTKTLLDCVNDTDLMDILQKDRPLNLAKEFEKIETVSKTLKESLSLLYVKMDSIDEDC